MTQRVEAMIGARAQGERALRRRRGPRGGRLPRLAAARQLRPAGRARVRDQATTPTAASPGSGLGILADEERSAYAHAGAAEPSCPRRCASWRTSGELLIVDKANARSPVHRHERMDYVGVRRVTPDGEIAGEARLLGLFTTKAYTEPASETPVLHRKLRRVLEAEDLIEGSHDYKAAVALFDTFPKDELFAAPVDDLRRAVVALLALEGTDRVRLLGRRARGRAQRLVHPRAARATATGALLVERVRKLFKRRFEADDVEAQHMLGEGDARARALPRARAATGCRTSPTRELEREVVQLARTWDDALRDALVERYGAARARLLWSIWAAAPARALQGLHGAGDAARWTSRCSSSWPRTGRSWSRCSRCASTRASRSTSAGRRSSWATRCRCSRTSGCA